MRLADALDVLRVLRELEALRDRVAHVDVRFFCEAVLHEQRLLVDLAHLGREHAALHGDDLGDRFVLFLLGLDDDLAIEGEGDEARALPGMARSDLTDEAALPEHGDRARLERRVGRVLEPHRLERELLFPRADSASYR